MRKIDRNTKSRGTASRGHAGAARILRPRSPAPSIGPRRLGQRLLEDIGLGGAAHPLRRAQGIIHGQGGPMAFPLGGPKFPHWMEPPVGARYAGALDAETRLASLNRSIQEAGLSSERANPLLPATYPIASERRIGGYGPPRKQLLEALNQMNQDTPTNRGFLLWMMRHHFGNRN